MVLNGSIITETLRSLVDRHSNAYAQRWLDDRLESVRRAESDEPLLAGFGWAPEIFGRDDLPLDTADHALAEHCRPDWNLRGWTVDQAARILLVLEAMATHDRPADILTTLLATADERESVTLYRGLPLYPEQAHHVARAAEGTRSNMRTIFEAIAHRNPYPSERFPQAAWNQMVVKALFIGSTLAPICNLDRRQNPDLTLMLRGYAHERWAAGRTVSPEVWRCVGLHGGPAAVVDLERVLASGVEIERRAAILALAANGSPHARELMQTYPDRARDADSGTLTWTTLFDTPQATKGRAT